MVSVWYYGIWAVELWRKSHLFYLSHFETYTSRLQRRKMCLLFSNISFRSRGSQVFKICKLAKWWRHTLNQILFKYDEMIYLSQFVAEMFDFWQQDYNKCAPQYELNRSVIMATNWVPDLLNIKIFFGHLWRSILIFANSTSYAWSIKHINMLTRVCGLV